MVNLINLGSFLDVGGRTVSSGIASGLDTGALLEALVEAREIPKIALETRIETTGTQLSAFAEFRSLLTSFQESANLLRNSPGIFNAKDNFFQYRTASLSSNTGVAASNYLSVTTKPGAQTGNYAVEVTNLAVAQSHLTDAFATQTDAVTEATGGGTAGSFSAGTFYFAGNHITQTVTTASSNILTAADITQTGTIGSLFDSSFGTGGIGNITITGTGDYGLVGDLNDTMSAVTASQSGGVGSAVTLTAVINGKSYLSNAITANTGASLDEIAAGSTITFTESSTGTSFDIQNTAAITIANSADLNNFASNTQSALDTISFTQSRTLGNFDAAKVPASTIDGLTIDDVRLISDGFDVVSNNHGGMANIVVNAVSGPGNNDGSISLSIDGELFIATGLGDDGGDAETSNIVLNSMSSNKQLQINLADAVISLDLSSASSAEIITRDLNLVFGTSVAVTLDEGDNLIDIESAIDVTSAASGVSATIIKAAEDSFRLKLIAENEGLDNAYNLIDVDGVVTDVNTTITTAEDATMTLDGITITRATNIIDDALTDVTFSLLSETPALTKISSNITEDTTQAKDAIVNFLTLYNDVKIFHAKQTERIEDGAFAEGAVLGNDPTLTTIMSRIESELSRIVDGIAAGDPSRLSEIGITLTNYEGDEETPPVANIFTLDDTVLDQALINNFEGVRNVFEFNFAASSNDLLIASRTNGLAISSFSVDVDTSRPSGDEVRITYTDVNNVEQVINATFTATATGGTITGQDGTVIEGLKMLYLGDGQDVIAVSATQGIADRIFNSLGEVLEADGVIDSAVVSLEDKEDAQETELARLQNAIDQYRERQLDRLAALEVAIKTSNDLLLFLDANTQAYNNARN